MALTILLEAVAAVRHPQVAYPVREVMELAAELPGEMDLMVETTPVAVAVVAGALALRVVQMALVEMEEAVL
jgi:hypothetical protein